MTQVGLERQNNSAHKGYDLCLFEQRVTCKASIFAAPLCELNLQNTRLYNTYTLIPRFLQLLLKP